MVEILNVLETDIAVHVFSCITVRTTSGRIETGRPVQMTAKNKEMFKYLRKQCSFVLVDVLIAIVFGIY